MCAESLKKETDTLTRNRLSFIASECLNARANYNDYLLSKQLVAKSFREGLLGKEVAGLALVAIFFEANFALGTIVGRNSLNSFHGMFN